MAIIQTQGGGQFEVLELPGPRPGVVWLLPWQLSLRVKRGPTGDMKLSTLLISATTMGLRMQGRSVDERGDHSDIQALASQRPDDDLDDEGAAEQLERLRQSMVQEGMSQRMGEQLPPTFQPPNDSGFIVSITDGGEAVRDNRGRRNKRSTVRIAKEAWLRIAPSNRIRLYPSPMLFPSDPLWAPGAFIRLWMSATCVPFFRDMVLLPSAQRPRGLQIAIPSQGQEPGHSIALRTLQDVFANEARSRADCRIQEPRSMTPGEAAIVLRMWDAIAGTPITRPRRAAQFGLSASASPEQIAQRVILASQATKTEIQASLFSKQQHDAARTIINNVFRSTSLDSIRSAFERGWSECDPDRARTPQEEEVLNEQCRMVEAAYERLLLARFLNRNPLTFQGPPLGRDSAEERSEGARQAVKIMTFDPRTSRLGIRRDAAWKFRLPKAKLDLVVDEDGNLMVDSSTIGTVLLSWVRFIWGSQIDPSNFNIGLDGLNQLAAQIFYGRM